MAVKGVYVQCELIVSGFKQGTGCAFAVCPPCAQFGTTSQPPVPLKQWSLMDAVVDRYFPLVDALESAKAGDKIMVVAFGQGVDTLVFKALNAEAGALHGTLRALVAGMVKGVTDGYVKELEIQGVGFKANLKGKQLAVNRGTISDTWATANADKVSCIYADNPGSNPDVFRKLGDLAANDVPLLLICGSIDPLLGKNALAIESMYQQFGARVSIMIKEGAGHHVEFG